MPGRLSSDAAKDKSCVVFTTRELVFYFLSFFFFHTDKMYEPDATTSSDPDLKIGTDTKSVASTLSNHVQLPPVGTNDDHKAYVSHARLGGPNQTR